MSGAWSYLGQKITRSGGLAGFIRMVWRNFRALGWAYLRGAIVRHLFELGSRVKAVDEHPLSRDYAAWFAQGHMRRAPRWTPADGPGPLVSVVMPVYRPDLGHFRAAVASVLAQDYPHWELCMADDASGDPALREFMEQLAAGDDRIKVCFRAENGHISACSNSALALAQGDFVLLFDQDDLLPAHAISVVAKAVLEHPDAAILYSDEDKVDEQGTLHFDPYFKPDFDLELFLGQNMVSHLGVYRRDVVMAVGGFRLGLEGSQDYDLALRVLEQVGAQRVLHLPEVLYHWRASRGSTALANSEKSYASTAAREAVSGYLHRAGVDARVGPVAEVPFFNRVDYPPAPPGTTVAVVFLLPAQTGSGELENTLRLALEGCGKLSWRAVVLQPTQARGNIEWVLRRLKSRFDVSRVQVVAVEDDSAAKARLGEVSTGSSDLVCLVSVPLQSAPAGWMQDMASMALQPRMAGVAPRLLGPLGYQCHGGLLMPDATHARHAFAGMPAGANPQCRSSALAQSFQALSPAVLLARTALWSTFDGRTGTLDARWTVQAMMLAWHGQSLANVWTPFTTLKVGRQVAAISDNLCEQLSADQLQQWSQACAAWLPDRAYNPNLSDDGGFKLKVSGV
ncbi:MAG: glycosyltransferase [Burkholderiaceae bacterium]